MPVSIYGGRILTFSTSVTRANFLVIFLTGVVVKVSLYLMLYIIWVYVLQMRWPIPFVGYIAAFPCYGYADASSSEIIKKNATH